MLDVSSLELTRADGGVWRGRTYLEEQLRVEKEFTTELEDDLEDLQSILALGKKEAADIVQETTSKVYRCLPRIVTLGDFLQEPKRRGRA